MLSTQPLYNHRQRDDGKLFSVANHDEESQQRRCVSVSGVCACLNTQGVVKLKDDMHNILEALMHVLLLNNWLLHVCCERNECLDCKTGRETVISTVVELSIKPNTHPFIVC